MKTLLDSQPYETGLATGRKFVHDIGAKFGTFVPQPKNPHKNGTEAHREWKAGYDEAIGEWFRK